MCGGARGPPLPASPDDRDAQFPEWRVRLDVAAARMGGEQGFQAVAGLRRLPRLGYN